MVQIIQRTRPTFGEQFAGGLVKGGEAAQRFAEIANEQRLAQKTKEIERTKKLADLAELQKSDYWKKASNAERSIIEAEAKGLVSAQTAKSLINQYREQEAGDFLNRIQGAEPGSERDNQMISARAPGGSPYGLEMLDEETGGKPMGISQPPTPKKINATDDFDKKIDYWRKVGSQATSKEIRDVANKNADFYQKQKEFQFQEKKQSQSEKQFAHAQTADFAKEIRETAEKGKEVVTAANEIKRISKKGVTGLNARNAIFTALKKRNNPFADAFASEDIQTIQANTKSLMGGTLKEIVGARPTASEFFWLENIVPNILKDAPTNEASANYFLKLGKQAERRGEIFDEIVKENKGFRPIDIETQVRDRMREENENLIEEGYKIAPPDVRVNIMNPDTGEILNIPANKFQFAKQEGFQVIP
jgi:hypothetical protein